MTKGKEKIRIFELDSASQKVTRWIGSTTSLVFHTVAFAFCFLIVVMGAPLDRVLLILTTIVSLEAIYLGIFIQMTVNKNSADIDEIQEDVEDIAEDVDEIQKDIDEIQEDVDEIVEVSDESEPNKTTHHKETHPEILEKIQHVLESLARDVEALKNKER